jgi:hypothetical protein
MIFYEDIIERYISIFDFDQEEKDEILVDLLDLINLEFIDSLSEEEASKLSQINIKDTQEISDWIQKEGVAPIYKEKITSAIKKILESWATAMAEDLSDEKKEELKEKLKLMDQTIQSEIKSEQIL